MEMKRAEAVVQPDRAEHGRLTQTLWQKDCAMPTQENIDIPKGPPELEAYFAAEEKRLQRDIVAAKRAENVRYVIWILGTLALLGFAIYRATDGHWGDGLVGVAFFVLSLALLVPRLVTMSSESHEERDDRLFKRVKYRRIANAA